MVLFSKKPCGEKVVLIINLYSRRSLPSSVVAERRRE
jgi:hypothetical protein